MNWASSRVESFKLLISNGCTGFIKLRVMLCNIVFVLVPAGGRIGLGAKLNAPLFSRLGVEVLTSGGDPLTAAMKEGDRVFERPPSSLWTVAREASKSSGLQFLSIMTDLFESSSKKILEATLLASAVGYALFVKCICEGKDLEKGLRIL